MVSDDFDRETYEFLHRGTPGLGHCHGNSFNLRIRMGDSIRLSKGAPIRAVQPVTATELTWQKVGSVITN
ncbi:hypothetical protein PAXRUDRAFT_825953 [Paxillus rubicundulus Ve08.2h10]|uniref:Uncharacterized protein n=1 Tax=Paxillus rubicundulus Ve08.2h10 TaxID=930991 RepID=A0A0D0DSJ0_9AGAM|nr:hypothetical protein PAXRUDRAFT_825953 [Paxillus rubicundulus Ve08.2h10]